MLAFTLAALEILDLLARAQKADWFLDAYAGVQQDEAIGPHGESRLTHFRARQPLGKEDDGAAVPFSCRTR